MRDMLCTKVKIAAAALLACLAALTVAVVAAGQRPGESAAKKETPQAPAARAKLKARSLPPEALAAHLGVIHQSFELTFDRPVPRITLSVDVYENGKRTVEGHAMESREMAKKHVCSVMYSRWKEEGKLLI